MTQEGHMTSVIMFGQLIGKEFGWNGVVVSSLSKNYSFKDVLFYVKRFCDSAHSLVKAEDLSTSDLLA